MRKGTSTAEWIKKLGLHGKTNNPSYVKRIPKKLEYLHLYDMESSYTTPRGSSESPKSYKRRLYTLHLTSTQAAAGRPEKRVEKQWPNIDWVQTWKNLKEAPVPETTRNVWYRVIHEINPTNERLHHINMVRQCASKDTLEHSLLVCGEGRMIWE